MRSSLARIIGISRHRLSTDGDGVTTLVAFHGCPLNCLYVLTHSRSLTAAGSKNTLPNPYTGKFASTGFISSPPMEVSHSAVESHVCIPILSIASENFAVTAGRLI